MSSVNKPNKYSNTTYKWGINSQSNWKAFDELLDKIISYLTDHTRANIIQTDLLKFMEESVGTVIKKKIQYLSEHERNAPSWGANKCTNSNEERKAPQKKHKFHMNLSSFIKYKKAEAKSKRLFKQKCKDSWTQFCNFLNLHSNTSQIWRKVNTVKSRSNYLRILESEKAEEFFKKSTPVFTC